MQGHRRHLTWCAGAFVVLAGCCFLRPGPLQRHRPLTYYLHSSIPGAWTTSITNAAVTWNGVHPLFTHGGYSGQASDNFRADGVNSVFLGPLPNPSALGMIRGTPEAGTCGLIDTDFGFNDNVAWSSTAPLSFEYDVESTALHELGHFGLLHHVLCPSSAVMRPDLGRGETRRSLSACDSLGMHLTNVLPECYVLTGICFPSFSFLRAFDDSDEEYQQTVDPFGSHHEEMTQIWKGDSTLRANADSVGDFYSRMLDDWRNGGTLARSEYFTSTRYQEIDSKIIARMYANASTGLRQRLDGVRGALQAKIGKTLPEIFTSEIRLSVPGGGYQPPGSNGPPPV